jgi:MoaA/NifB/PqqE/SkfB family radical SAM enzyme
MQALKIGKYLWKIKRKLKQKHISFETGYHDCPPPGIFIDISSYCNLSCKMCPYLKVHETPTNMSMETFKKLLPEIEKIDHISIVGAGEPTINKNLIPFIKFAQEANPNVRVDLTTNGTLITEYLCNELIDLKLRRVVFSIDGANAQTVESIRLGVNFSKVIANIQLLHRLKEKKRSSSPIIRANFMVGYGNYKYLADFVILADETGINEIHFMEIQASNYDDYRDNLLNGIAKDEGKVLKEAINIAKEKGIKLSLPIMHETVCHAPYVPHISEEGEVFPCCYYAHHRKLYSDGKEILLPSLSLGNTNRDGFRSIWNSRDYKQLRKDCDTGNFNEFCDACYKARLPTSEKIKKVLTDVGADPSEYGI